LAQLKPIPEHEASGEAARVYEEIRETLGIVFVPNFFKTLANSPTALRATWEAYRNVSWRGNVPTVLKEMMFVAISAARKCHYCETAHLAFCKLPALTARLVAASVENLDAILPRRSADVVKFAVKAALNPAEMDSADYQGLRDHGISDAEIAGILAMTRFRDTQRLQQASGNLLSNAIKFATKAASGSRSAWRGSRRWPESAFVR
jgi:uncharacterized peroxidase-related enzyme